MIHSPSKATSMLRPVNGNNRPMNSINPATMRRAAGVAACALVAAPALTQVRTQGYARAGMAQAQSLLDEARKTARSRLSTLGIECARDVDLGEALARAGVDPAAVDECLMGNVVSAGLGQNPARQAALGGGLPDTVGALTVNKVCGSGLKTVMLAAQGIATGDIDIAVAGGMESMSSCPYLLPRIREGLRMGDGQVVDSMIHDGLWCAFENFHMGHTGEIVAEKYGVTRAEQDAYAASSHQKAARATQEGWFKDEILPVQIPQRKGDPIVVDRDEEPFATPLEKLEKMGVILESELTPEQKKKGPKFAFSAPEPGIFEMVVKLDKDPKKIVHYFIDRIIARMFYSKDEVIEFKTSSGTEVTIDNRYIRVDYFEGSSKVFCFKEFLSGSILRNVVDRAKKRALVEYFTAKLEAEKNGGEVEVPQPTLRIRHFFDAVEEAFAELESLPNTVNPDEWIKMWGLGNQRVKDVVPIIRKKKESVANVLPDEKQGEGPDPFM